MTTQTHSGGCQCGALRYRINGPFGKAGFCHCRMCQKAFGSFGAPLISVPFKTFAWTRGSPAIFQSSSIVKRGFCAACGTPLFMREDGDTNIELAIGTLDDPNDIPPLSEQVGVESKVAWFDTINVLRRADTDDYRTPEDMAKLKTFQHPDHDTEHWPLR
jgi:hypothetical protein